jgi:steroid Delta-isomerase
MSMSTLMSVEQIEASARNYFAAIRSQAIVENMLDCYSDQVEVNYIFPAQDPIVGKEALRQFFQSLIDQLEQVSVQESFVAASHDQAAVKWVGVGVGKNGRSIQFEGIDILKFHTDGKIKTLLAYWDPTNLMAQLA